jgi:hypothetical protein
MSFRLTKICALGLAAAAGLLASSASYAQKPGVFAKFHGAWVGNGEIHLSNGSKEIIRCRGDFVAADAGANSTLKLEVKCANPGYKFELQGDLIYSNGAVGGTWTEITRGLNGKVTGKVADDKISAVAEGQTFTATIDLTSFGDKQHIIISSPGSEIANVLIGLIRSGVKASQVPPAAPKTQ